MPRELNMLQRKWRWMHGTLLCGSVVAMLAMGLLGLPVTQAAVAEHVAMETGSSRSELVSNEEKEHSAPLAEVMVYSLVAAAVVVCVAVGRGRADGGTLAGGE